MFISTSKTHHKWESLQIQRMIFVILKETTKQHANMRETIHDKLRHCAHFIYFLISISDRHALSMLLYSCKTCDTLDIYIFSVQSDYTCAFYMRKHSGSVSHRSDTGEISPSLCGTFSCAAQTLPWTWIPCHNIHNNGGMFQKDCYD